jgi:hypothetical protein
MTMRKLAVAVFGAIALAVASSAAYAIENSSWFGAGEVLLRLKTRGERAFVAEGAFQDTGLFVGSSLVNLPIDEVQFLSPSNVTATALSGVLADVRRITTRRVNVDNEGSSTQITLRNLIQDFVDLTTVTVTAFTTKPPRGEEPSIPDPAAGFVVFQDTIDIRGGFTAVNNFTEVNGKLTIVFKGIENGGPSDGKPFKGTIIVRYEGVRD